MNGINLLALYKLHISDIKKYFTCNQDNELKY